MIVPILSFVKMYREYIIGITCFADTTDDKKETSIEVKHIKIEDKYIYFVGFKGALGVPIDGAIIDLDCENQQNNLITVFNKRFGYIRTKKYVILNN